MGNEKMYVWAIVAFIVGGIGGYALGSVMTTNAINAQIAEQQSTNARIQAGTSITNPLQNVQTNPYENIKTNPFN